MDKSIPASSLKHYGVKGMKWGVRKSDSGGGSGGSSRPKTSDDSREATATQRKIDKGGVKSVSNKELQALVNRRNLEKQYNSLLVEQKSSMDRGNDSINKLLKYGKTYNDVMKFLNSPAGQKVKAGFKVAGMAAKVGAAYATGGTSAAAGAAGSIVIRRAANHYTNVGN